MSSKSSAAMEEEAIIRKRFLTQTVATSAVTIPPFKKLVKKYTEFCQAAESGTKEDALRLHEELLADLYAVQLHMQRLDASAASYRREQELYKQKQEQLQAAIVQAEQDINDRKVALEEARAELARQQEYEAVKKRVTKVPSRSSTRAEMAAVEKEIADLTQQGIALDSAMDRRRVQFASIVHLIEQVYAGLESEGGEEGGLAENGVASPEAMQVG